MYKHKCFNKKLSYRWQTAFAQSLRTVQWCGWPPTNMPLPTCYHWPPTNMPLSHVLPLTTYKHASLTCGLLCWPITMDQNECVDIHQKNWVLTSHLSRSLKVIGTDMDWSGIHEFLSMFHSNLRPPFQRHSEILIKDCHLFWIHVYFRLHLGDFPWTGITLDGLKKLERRGYQAKKKVWYLLQFRYNTRVWWTDGWTDGQTEGPGRWRVLCFAHDIVEKYNNHWPPIIDFCGAFDFLVEPPRREFGM